MLSWYASRTDSVLVTVILSLASPLGWYRSWCMAKRIHWFSASSSGSKPLDLHIGVLDGAT
jgi:hypothetical protein